MRLIISLLIGFCLALEGREPPLGMWVWGQIHLESEEARGELLDFCGREEIAHIDQHVSIKKGMLLNEEALRNFIIKAADRGITVNALRGDKAMFFASNHELTMVAVKTIVAFNETLPDGKKLLGIKFDVEPYGSQEWKVGRDQRSQVMRDYLNYLNQVDAYLSMAAPEMELAVDVPFWWDKTEFQMVFEGQKKLFVEHVQDRVDWLGIMSYRRDPSEIAKLVATELNYASKFGYLRSVAPSMETGNITGKEAYISFGGVPVQQFRSSLSSLRNTYANNPYVRCIMLHHYDSLRVYLGETEY
ncbi:MAG: hypothetical protein ISR41_08100 [Puniceicoccaceae bacterium]|nr:hypothetical protein [Puniceicoccaceae bacterium]